MKIGIYSSSVPQGSMFPKRSKRANDFLTAKGHEIILGECFAKRDFYRTDSIINRVKEINNLVTNKDIVLMSSIGGWNTSSVLPYLNYELINKNVKVITGFSDSTAILQAVINKAPNVRVFYGPSFISTFGDLDQNVLNYSYESFMNQINKKNELILKPSKIGWTDDFKNWEEFESDKQFHKDEWIWGGSKTVTGRLVGGNLNTMLGIWGTEYNVKISDGDILFIEDSSKDISLTERSLNLLLLSGVLNKVAGIIIGRHELFDDQGSGRTTLDVLNEILRIAKIELPIVADVNFSHIKPMQIIELNVPTTIDFNKKEIRQ